KNLGVGDAASADLVSGLQHDKALARRRKSPPGRDARSAGAHDDGINPARARYVREGRRTDSKCAPGGKRRARGGKKRSPAQDSHGCVWVLRLAKSIMEGVLRTREIFFIIRVLALSRRLFSFRRGFR